MRVRPARVAPSLKPHDQIAPHQLWSHLSVSQQQHVRQVLIGVAQQLLAHALLVLAQRGDASANSGHMLAQAEVEAFN